VVYNIEHKAGRNLKKNILRAICLPALRQILAPGRSRATGSHRCIENSPRSLPGIRPPTGSTVISSLRYLVFAELWRVGIQVDWSGARYSLEFLRNLAAKLHAVSKHGDPIAISDQMSGTDEILYVPLMFGYSNYARDGFRRHRLRFANAPCGSTGRHGSVLGGVGLSLSARSRSSSGATALARRIADPEIQRGIYANVGGQPGHATAWNSSAGNDQTVGFFRLTQPTMRDAFVRPRVSGHRRFRVQAGELIHRFIWDRKVSVGRACKNFPA
jgi:hypothetical protein